MGVVNHACPNPNGGAAMYQNIVSHMTLVNYSEHSILIMVSSAAVDMCDEYEHAENPFGTVSFNIERQPTSLGGTIPLTATGC